MYCYLCPVLGHPGSIDTPPVGRSKPALSSTSSSVVSTPTFGEGRPKPFSLDEAETESPSLGLAKETGVKYVKTKTNFDAISKVALEAVREMNVFLEGRVTILTFRLRPALKAHHG